MKKDKKKVERPDDFEIDGDLIAILAQRENDEECIIIFNDFWLSPEEALDLAGYLTDAAAYLKSKS